MGAAKKILTKIKAFTLIEVLVVLAISSTVIVLAMWTYMNIAAYLRSYSTNETKNQEISMFLEFWNKDLDACHTIEDEGEYIQLNYLNQEAIIYELFFDYIIREQDYYQDTFNIGITSFNTFEHASLEGKISEIELILKASGVEYPIRFFKTYSNQQLIEAYEY